MLLSLNVITPKCHIKVVNLFVEDILIQIIHFNLKTNHRTS